VEEFMTNPILFVVAGVMLAATAPVQAGTPDSPGGTVSAGTAGAGGTIPKALPGPKTKYCVVDETTGSRIPRKVCLTRQEWLGRGFDPTAKPAN
jgi:hypothetical protein